MTPGRTAALLDALGRTSGRAIATGLSTPLSAEFFRVVNGIITSMSSLLLFQLIFGPSDGGGENFSLVGTSVVPVTESFRRHPPAGQSST